MESIEEIIVDNFEQTVNTEIGIVLFTFNKSVSNQGTFYLVNADYDSLVFVMIKNSNGDWVIPKSYVIVPAWVDKVLNQLIHIIDKHTKYH